MEAALSLLGIAVDVEFTGIGGLVRCGLLKWDWRKEVRVGR